MSVFVKGSQIKVTLKRSHIGKMKKHVRIFISLGLAHRGDSRVHLVSPQIIGQINKVLSFVDVESYSS